MEAQDDDMIKAVNDIISAVALRQLPQLLAVEQLFAMIEAAYADGLADGEHLGKRLQRSMPKVRLGAGMPIIEVSATSDVTGNG